MLVDINVKEMNTKLDRIIPTLLEVLQNGVANMEEEDGSGNETSDDENEASIVATTTTKSKSTDKLLYTALNCLGKLFSHQDLILLNKKFTRDVSKVLGKGELSIIVL